MTDFFSRYSCLLDVGTSANVARAFEIYAALMAENGREDPPAEPFLLSLSPEYGATRLWLRDPSSADQQLAITFVTRCAETFGLTGRWGFQWANIASNPVVEGFFRRRPYPRSFDRPHARMDQHRALACRPACGRRCAMSTSKENSSARNSEPAQRYAAMAEVYIAAIGALVPVAPSIHAPFHMMVGHALELSIKALLAHQGRNEEWLMMVGHNLGACHRLALSSEFNSRAAEGIARLVYVLNGPHLDQRFRYPSVFPAISDVPAPETFETLRLHLEDVRSVLAYGSVDL